MPPFYTWTHVCLAYDGLKDIYKLYVNGEKRESGSWGTDNRQVCVGVYCNVVDPDPDLIGPGGSKSGIIVPDPDPDPGRDLTFLTINVTNFSSQMVQYIFDWIHIFFEILKKALKAFQ
jgi:hypothetical protein